MRPNIVRLLLLAGVGCWPVLPAASRAAEQPLPLGSVPVDNHAASVFFHDPADDGKNYRVTVAISKRWADPPIQSKRIDVWLLARGGKALPVKERPRDGVLIEAGSAGATANAIFVFERTVPRRELAAVIVAVDGEPKAFRVDAKPPPRKEMEGLFPVLPPVPTADPAVRSAKEFRVIRELRARRAGKSVEIESVPDALETVKVRVGKDMVTGLRYEVFIRPEGKPVRSGLRGMESRPAAAYGEVSVTLTEAELKALPPGKKFKVDVRLTLFETDIPVQHLWAPEAGRYKALWSRTLTVEAAAP